MLRAIVELNLCLRIHILRSAAMMSKASVSSLLLSGGAGNGRGAGGVAEGRAWGRGEGDNFTPI